MIKKLENGATLITLGEGTVFTGNAFANDDTKPFGIFFTNEQGSANPEGSIVIELTSDKAIASYVMALVRYVEALNNGENSELTKIISNFKNDLEPILPKKNDC